MKFGRLIIILLAAVFAAIGCSALSACGSVQGRVQQLDYTESLEKINNPDQGFYKPVYVKLTESGASYAKYVITEETQLYHLRIDISAFSGAVNGNSDLPLTQDALDGFEEILSYLRERDKNAVVRFAYDPAFNGSKDKEPELRTMLTHIGQICPIINGYENTVTAVEAGLIGPWGEMHSSAVANSETIKQITEAYLTNTQSVPVLVRTPKMIYDYLGITLADIDGYTVAETETAYRLGIFNDGYLGSATDWGTYTDREREVEFLANQTSHLPYGGEAITASSGLNGIDVCLPEMNKLNLSYLNVEWDNAVIDKWKNSFYTASCGGDEKYYGSTAFAYLENRLGYRFVLKKSVFSYSEKSGNLQIELTLENVGFGNLNRKKLAKIIFTDAEGSVAFVQSVADFTGGGSYNCALDPELQSGTYDVYLCLYGEQYGGVPLYSLQFANGGLWNSELKANKIGSLEL